MEMTGQLVETGSLFSASVFEGSNLGYYAHVHAFAQWVISMASKVYFYERQLLPCMEEKSHFSEIDSNQAKQESFCLLDGRQN